MSGSLRIALVSAFPPGRQSLNEYGLHLARGLADREDVAEVVVLADKLDEELPELDLGPKVTVRRVWSFNSLAAVPSILSALRQVRPDGAIYNLQTASFGDRESTAGLGLLAPMLSRMIGVPSGVITHNIVAGVDLDQTMLKGQRIRQAIVRVGGAAITRALVSSTYLTVTLRSYADILKARFPGADIELVPHGTFDTEQRDLAPLAERPARVVTMGKFGTYKRLETLLSAFDRLRSIPGFKDLQLVIGGTDHPNMPGYLAGLAAERAGDRGVVFHGYVAEDDVPDFFGSARISVFDYTSTTGSSGVLHQTASYGAVPVFPMIGDFVDVCADEGLTGLNYRPGDVDSMAQAMRQALEDTETATAIADGNRRAAGEMPFADVIDYHVRKLCRLAPAFKNDCAADDMAAKAA